MIRNQEVRKRMDPPLRESGPWAGRKGSSLRLALLNLIFTLASCIDITCTSVVGGVAMPIKIQRGHANCPRDRLSDYYSRCFDGAGLSPGVNDRHPVWTLGSALSPISFI